MAAVEHLLQYSKDNGSSLATIAGTQSEKMARKKALKHLFNGSGRTLASASQGQGFESSHHRRHSERENGEEKSFETFGQ
jgi:hypothetical protein